ncbi:pyrimidine reductase family protein [Catellatospora vulcania]|uniref:pyrimidine reductase family protein n=1 Tax=Catellatospora vulcania TaxID=1460450 RepID=UPI001E352387|nr:pyrimidine reductase family protein [Catellatospora vulcania]
MAALDDEDLVRLHPRAQTPWLRVNFVSSLDGAVAVDGLSAGLSGDDDKRVFRLLRKLCDGLLVGAGTLRDERYRPLTLDAARRAWRGEHGLPAYPRLVVVSATLRLDPAAPALADAPVRPLILTGPAADPAARRALSAVADVADIPDLATGLRLLHDQGLTQLLCEGGPRLLGSLTEQDLVDDLCLTLSPLLAGPGSGRITAGPPHPPRPMTTTHVLTTDEGFLLTRHVRK